MWNNNQNSNFNNDYPQYPPSQYEAFNQQPQSHYQNQSQPHHQNYPLDSFGEPLNDNYNQFNYNTSGGQNNDDCPAKTSDLYGAARTAFIRKVYTILSCQIFVTVLMTGLSMASTSFFQFQLQNIWLFYVAIFATIAIEIYIFCCNGARTFPANMITLGIFTFFQGYIVSFISSLTGQKSGNDIVFMAAFMTLVITITCTLYAMYTKQDYTTSSLVIIVLGVALLLLFIITLFTDSPFIRNLLCCVGVLLFSFYLIIDTQMIMGGKQIELTVDEYALAAMLLYIDIIQIFLYLLQLFSNNSE